MTLLIIGSSGHMGYQLTTGLTCAVRPFDLPAGDARDREALRSAASGIRQILHLGWDMQEENYRNNRSDPANIEMAANVLQVALDLHLDRVVLASSVHAGLQRPRAPLPIRIAPAVHPTTPYGRSKLHIEGLGRAAAAKGLGVVAIRFGGVQPARPRDPQERGRWLSHPDLVNVVQRALDAPLGPDNWEVLHAVSRGFWRRHSVRNGLGWSPLRRRAL